MKMRSIGELLTEVFQRQPYAELSTSELIKQLYPDEYEKIKTALHDPLSDREARTVAKRHKGQLHRRVLYHLNRLEEDGIIAVSAIKGKGEKCYSLTRQHRKHNANNHAQGPLTQPLDKLESYREEGILKGYDRQGWHHRLNAVLLQTKSTDDAKRIRERIAAMSRHVNDVIGLRGMEHVLENEDLTTITGLLKGLDIDTRDNNRTISLLIDLEAAKDDTKHLEDFFEAYALLKPQNMNIVLSTTPKYLEAHQRLIKHIIRQFSRHTIKINLHNKDVHEAPIMVGRAGTYTLNEQDWSACQKEEQPPRSICVSQVSVGVDVHRFFQRHRSDTEFRNFILKVARALVESTTLQRRRAENAFEDIMATEEEPHQFFRYSTNHIRLWNYDWEEEDHPHLSELLATCAEELDRFCTTEEVIYKSCGMPIRFRVALASMFSKFETGFFSKRQYRKLSVSGRASLEKEDFRKFITSRERIVEQLRHNDRVRIFRTTPADPEETAKEMRHLMSEYRIPHLTYDFAQRRADMTLTHFFRGGEE